MVGVVFSLNATQAKTYNGGIFLYYFPETRQLSNYTSPMLEIMRQKLDGQAGKIFWEVTISVVAKSQESIFPDSNET